MSGSSQVHWSIGVVSGVYRCVGGEANVCEVMKEVLADIFWETY